MQKKYLLKTNQNPTFAHHYLYKTHEKFQNDREIRNKAKYLGVNIDRNLSWNAHMQFLYKKLSKAIGQMARLRAVLTNSALRNVCFAIFHQLH